MSVQGQEFAQLAIHNPPHRAIRVLALDAEDGFVAMQRMETVRDPNTQTVEECRHSPMSFLIPFDPEPEHERRKTAGDKLVGDVDSMRGHGRRGTMLRFSLTGDMREQRA